MLRIRPLKRTQTLKDMAYDQVKSLLRAGSFSGDVVLSANHLADSLHVSRTPVREALLQLCAEGLLAPVGSRGFRMRSYTPDEIRDTFEARLALECFAAEQLARQAPGDRTTHLATLTVELNRMLRAAGDNNPDEFLHADEAFHLALFQATGNDLLLSMMENLRDRIAVLGHRALAVRGRMQAVVAEHRKILAAIQKADAARAREAMAEHLEQTLRELANDRRQSELAHASRTPAV